MTLVFVQQLKDVTVLAFPSWSKKWLQQFLATTLLQSCVQRQAVGKKDFSCKL